MMLEAIGLQDCGDAGLHDEHQQLGGWWTDERVVPVAVFRLPIARVPHCTSLWVIVQPTVLLG